MSQKQKIKSEEIQKNSHTIQKKIDATADKSTSYRSNSCGVYFLWVIPVNTVYNEAS